MGNCGDSVPTRDTQSQRKFTHRKMQWISENSEATETCIAVGHSGVKPSYRKMNLWYKGFKMLEKYIYMTKNFFINIGGRIKSQRSIFYTKVDPWNFKFY